MTASTSPPAIVRLAAACALGSAILCAQDDQGKPTTPAPRPEAPPRFEVTEHLDLAYGDPEAARIRHQVLDLFVPDLDGAAEGEGEAEGEGNRPPLLVFFHGGAWRGGSPGLYRPLGRALAEMGIAVALPGYRLTPHVQHPTHVEDCARSVAWLLEHGERLGYDPATLALGGHSAGGHLAALLATAPEFLAAHDLDRERIAGVIAMSAPLDVRAPAPVFTLAFGDDIDDRDDASPLRRELGEAPPFLILWADDDLIGLEMSARSMAKALEAAGVDCTARQIDERDHTSIARQTAQPEDPAAEAILAFLQRIGPRPR